MSGNCPKADRKRKSAQNIRYTKENRCALHKARRIARAEKVAAKKQARCSRVKRGTARARRRAHLQRAVVRAVRP